MQKIEALLICNSNMFIPVTLSEVLNHPNNQYLVISDTDNIRQFFGFLSIPNVVYGHYGFNPTKDGRFGFIHEKKELFDFVSQYDIKKVVFFHAEFGAMANWLVKKLSKKTPIKYCKLYDSIPAPKATFSFKTLKIKMAEWIYWGQNMDILSGTFPFPSLPKEYYHKVKAETITLPVDLKLINTYVKDKLNHFNIVGKFVLLTGTAVQNRWYSEKDYTSFINQLIEILGQEKVLSKCHPRYSSLYGKEKELIQVPSFIPGNVLLDNFDYFIGVESTLLVEAAQAGKISISIIDWLKPDNNMRMTLHATFENRLQGKGIIHYPTSADAFLEIIGAHKNCVISKK